MSGALWIAILFALFATVAYADFITDERLSLNFLFAPLVGAAAWRYGFVAAFAMSLAAALASVFDDLFGHDAVATATYAAASVRFAVFLTLGWMTVRFRLRLVEQRRLTEIDSLTGLATRQQLFKLGEHQLAVSRNRGAPLGALFIDCDHFKAINDRWGHSTGDELLREVASSIREVFDRDFISARLGGDEFVVIGFDLPSNRLRDKAERLQSLFAERMAARETALTLSIGAAFFHRPPATLDHVIAVADELMYRVKHDGRHGVAFCEYGGSNITSGTA